MFRSLLALPLLSLLVGCQPTQVSEKTDVSKQAPGIPPPRVYDSYAPPADGKLTEAQIEMYLKVRQKAQTPANSTPSGVATSNDEAAAKELGYNPYEYAWVKKQVLAASDAAVRWKLRDQEALLEAKTAQLNRRYGVSEKEIARFLKSGEDRRARVLAEESAAVTHNRELVSKYEAAVASSLEEGTTEADRQKAIEDWRRFAAIPAAPAPK